MRQDRKTKNDGYINFLGGVDSGRSPNLLAENQLAFAVNVSLRGGHACTRPGFRRIGLTFEDTETQDWWESDVNRIQGACFFNEEIFCAIAGRIFKIHCYDWTVKDITPRTFKETAAAYISPPTGADLTLTLTSSVTPRIGDPAWIQDGKYTVKSWSGNTVTLTNVWALPGVAIPSGSHVEFADLNASSRTHAYFQPVEKYLVIQDGSSAALIYDSTLRRADYLKKEVPTGTAMAYGMGRLWVATSERTFVAGDINNGPSSVLKFTENDYLNEGGSFAVPGDAGIITGMTFLSNLDTSLGQGPLLVFTENAIFSMNCPVNRDVWKNLTSPIQTVSMNKYGSTGQDSIQLVNGDCFYRSIDGLRTFILARRDFTTWGNLPVSREMTRVMTDDMNLLKFTSSALFDNRYFFTLGFRKDRTSAYALGLGVMDFDLLGGIGGKFQPVWEGIWTGLRFTKLVTGRIDGIDRCFSFAVDPDTGENQLWEITKDARFDEDGCKITSFVETRSMIHGSPFEATELTSAELWVDDLAGIVDFDMKYRPDQFPCWYNWADWQEEQTMRDCSEGTLDNCWIPTEYKPGYRTRMTLPKPVFRCEENDSKPASMGYEFQFRVQWSGHARIKRLLVKTTEIEEQITGNLVC